MNSKTIHRRKFLGGTAIGLLSLGLSSPVFKAGAQTRGRAIRIGFIGTGERGRVLIKDFAKQPDVSIETLCDANSEELSVAAALPGCENAKRYSDFRAALESVKPDALVIATPDHWHAVMAVTAMKGGADVYLEKPMSLSVGESLAISRAATKYKRVLQVGTQQRSGDLFRVACNLVQNGKLGQLTDIHVWCPGSVDLGARAPVAVPREIDYDMWLGPARLSPYTLGKCDTSNASKTWWHQTDYSLGFMATWGIHPMDIACVGGRLSLSQLVGVEGSGTFANSESATQTPLTWNVSYAFASGPNLKFTGHALKANTIAGHRDVHPFQERFGTPSSHGTAFVGNEGWLCVDRSGIRASSASILQNEKNDLLNNSRATEKHIRNFLDCVKSRSAPIASPEQAIIPDTLCHIANIAIHESRKLSWDGTKGEFRGDKAANQRFKPRAMRKPWTLV